MPARVGEPVQHGEASFAPPQDEVARVVIGIVAIAAEKAPVVALGEGVDILDSPGCPDISTAFGTGRFICHGSDKYISQPAMRQ